LFECFPFMFCSELSFSTNQGILVACLLHLESKNCLSQWSKNHTPLCKGNVPWLKIVYWLWLYYSSDQYSHKWLFCLSIMSLDSRRCIFAWPLWCRTLQPSPVHDSAYELRCNPWTCCSRIGIHSLCPCSRSHVIEHIYIYIYGGFNMIFLWKILYIEL
jgi:hypothetical protein